MKWNFVLNTREVSSDYKFHMCPDYISTMPQIGDEEEALIRRYIRQMERISLDSSSDDSVLKKCHNTLAFVFDKDAYYLLRYSKTNEKDDRGRIISTTEGIVCPRKEEKKVLLELVDSILYLLGEKKLIRERYFEGNLKSEISIPNRINWISNNKISKDMFGDLDSDIAIQLERLIAMLSRERKLFAFVLGSMASEMKKAVQKIMGDTLVIDLSIPVEVYSERKVERIHIYPLDEGENNLPLSLYYLLKREKKEVFETQWYVKDDESHTIAKTDAYKGTSITLQEIEKQEFLLDIYLKYHGFTDVL